MSKWSNITRIPEPESSDSFVVNGYVWIRVPLYQRNGASLSQNHQHCAIVYGSIWSVIKIVGVNVEAFNGDVLESIQSSNLVPPMKSPLVELPKATLQCPAVIRVSFPSKVAPQT